MTGGWVEGRGPEELADVGRPDADTVELLGTGADRTGADQTSAPGRPTGSSRSALVPLIGGLVAIIALVVALGRPGSVEEEAAPETSQPPPTTTTTAPPVPSTEPIVLDSPVVGERSGLTLFLGGDSPLTAIDLDSGEVTRYGVTAHPVVVTGSDLVLYQEEAEIVGWVPLDDPGQQALSWKRGQIALGSGPGLLWVLDPTREAAHPAGVEVGFGRWELFETATNRRVFEMPGDLYPDIERFIGATPMVGGAFEAFRPGPWFTTRRDGVYRAIEDGYTKVSGGRVLAVDDDAVLIEQCTVDGFCNLAWVGVETGDVVDRILPEVRPRVARLVADGTWLHSIGWAGTSELLELSTGRRIEHDWAADRPTISPDGNWLAHWSDTTLVVSDLRSDGRPRPVIGIDAIERGASDGLLFAASLGSPGLQSPPAS